MPIVREMTLHDAQRLAELTTQLGYPITSATMLGRIHLFLNNPYGKVFVAAIQDNVVGYICIWVREHFHDAHRAARILALVVDTNYQRRGIGTKLIAAAEQYAQQQGCISIDLTSGNKRIDAHVFYENLGYKPDQTKYFSKDFVTQK